MITALTAIVYTTALSAGLLVGDGTHRAAVLLVAILLLAHGVKRRAVLSSRSLPSHASLRPRLHVKLRHEAALPAQFGFRGRPRPSRRVEP